MTLLLAITLGCSSYESIDTAATIHGAELGATPEAVGGLAVHETVGEHVVVYRKADEDLTFGAAPLSYVDYRFLDGELYQVKLGTGQSKALLDEITARWGTPAFDTPWEWRGDKVKLKFNGSPIHGGATAVFTSVPHAKKAADLGIE